MGGLMLLLSLILAALVDFGTTAAGATEAFGLAGLIIGLALQAGQLSTLLMLRSDEVRGSTRVIVSVMAVVITAINAAFNYYALHGLLEVRAKITPSIPSALRSLTPADPDWGWNWMLLALCVFISTELEAAVAALSRMRGHLALISSSLPLYVTPITSVRAFWRGAQGGGGEAREANVLFIAIPPLMIMLALSRVIDAISTYDVLVGAVIGHSSFWAVAVAAYIALMAATYQARAVILLRTRASLGILETARVIAITALNIFCSIAFLSAWEAVAPLAIGLGLLISTLTEVLEAKVVVTLVANALGQQQQGGVREITEAELVRIIRQQAERVAAAYQALGATIGAPIRVILRAVSDMRTEAQIEVVPDSGGKVPLSRTDSPAMGSPRGDSPGGARAWFGQGEPSGPGRAGR